MRLLSILRSLLFPDDDIDRAVARATGTTLAAAARRAEPLHPPLSACFAYDDMLVKPLIIALKYRRSVRAAEVLAEALWQTLGEEYAERLAWEGAPILVPIPLSKQRKRERGYNQSELLAEALVRASGGLFELHTNLLERVRDTRPQTELSGNARRKNLSGCFRVAGSIPLGRAVVLLDDVTTTGSTLREALRALKEAGARNAEGLAAAH